jgi:hypothetical protein
MHVVFGEVCYCNLVVPVINVGADGFNSRMRK